MKISPLFVAGPPPVPDLSNPADIRLALRPDNASDFAHGFTSDCKARPIKIA